MGRLSRDEVLMQVAETTARRGTCSRLKVGVVFSQEGRIVMTGYNGAPAGMPHCDHGCNCIPGPGRIDHHSNCATQRPCTISQHAERNAIAFAARHGVALGGTEVHVTHMPCYDCAGSLINAGVVKVTWAIPYRDSSGIKLLGAAGIEVVDHVTKGEV